MRNHHTLRMYLCNIAMRSVPWMKCEHYLELRADYSVILCSWRLVLVCWNGDSLQHRCECVIKPCVYVCDWVIWLCMGVCAPHKVPTLSTWQKKRPRVKPIFMINFIPYIIYKFNLHAVTKASSVYYKIIFSIKLNCFCPEMFGFCESKNKQTIVVHRVFLSGISVKSKSDFAHILLFINC